MPNRILRESICTSETIAALSPDEEVLFYRLITQADDYGRFDGRCAVIKGRCFPLKDVTTDQIESWLAVLVQCDLIRFYWFEGRRYLFLVTWEKYQRVRAKVSRWPEPAADGGHPPSSAVTCPQVTTDVVPLRIRNPESVSRIRIQNPESVKVLCDDVFRERMVEKYTHQGISRETVVESIEDALAHKARKKWSNEQRYVANWLRRGFVNGANNGPHVNQGVNSERYRGNAPGVRGGDFAKGKRSMLTDTSVGRSPAITDGLGGKSPSMEGKPKDSVGSA